MLINMMNGMSFCIWMAMCGMVAITRAYMENIIAYCVCHMVISDEVDGLCIVAIESIVLTG